MKNLTLCFIFTLLFVSRLSGQGYITIDEINYQADTLEYRQIGPGTIYSKFNLPELSFDAYILEIDVSHAYNTLETFQAGNQVRKTEAMTKAYDRLSTEQHQALAAINGNFWVVANQGKDELLGVPHGGSARLSEMITELDPWNRPHGTTPEELLIDMGFAVVDEENRVWVDDMGFDGKVIIGNEKEYEISQINRLRGNGQLVFFNSYIGTHTRTDDDGTEVFIRPVEEDRWKVNEKVKCEVTRIIKDKGNNELREGESVLSGNGSSKEFLNQLIEGDIIEVYMGIYTLTDHYRPAVKEMISGNALIMKDGVLTNRNYNEPYNMNLYARTAVGVSEDGKTAYLIVIDRRGTSKGTTTAIMSQILRAAGAVSAVSLDGGGSAQMMLGGKIVSQPSDGSERPVANGWMIFSTAPQEDKTPAKLAFEDYKLDLPCYSSYQPNILVYNKYDVLIDEITQGYTLSCDANLGYIKNNSIFIASSNIAEGIITANYQGLSVSKEVKLFESELSFQLDSVIMDDRQDYKIGVLAHSSSGSYFVDPSNLEWVNLHPEICEVNDGVVTALKNGIAILEGSLDDFKEELKIKVQIPEERTLPIIDFSDLERWEVKVTTNLKDLEVISPANSSVSFNYTYTKGTSSSVRISPTSGNEDFYGIPDFIRLAFNPNEIGLSRVIMAITPNGQTSPITIEYSDIKLNSDNTFTISLKDIIKRDFTHADYPIKLNYFTFFLTASANEIQKKYTLDINDFSLVYEDYGTSISLEKVDADLSYTNPVTNGEIRIFTTEHKSRNVRIEVFSVSGQLIAYAKMGMMQEGEIIVSLPELLKGVYFLRLYQDEHVQDLKLIVN